MIYNIYTHNPNLDLSDDRVSNVVKTFTYSYNLAFPSYDHMN